MHILGIIPARSGSKSIPNKNIKLMNGKPLIAYTIESAQASSLQRFIVSTDSDEIADVARSYGAEVILRSPNLSLDSTPTLPVIQDVVKKIGGDFEAVMTLQPTSPLRNHVHIDQSIGLFESDLEADSLVSVVEVPHNFVPSKIMSYDGRFLNGNLKIVRRQDIERKYARNGAAIYITKINKLNYYLFGGKIIPYFMNKIDSFDIDEIEDWEIVSRLIKCVE